MTTRRLTFFLPLFFAGLAIDADGAGKVVRDIEFARVDEQSLKLDLYLPEIPKGSRLVVWIHGGGWRRGSKNSCRAA